MDPLTHVRIVRVRGGTASDAEDVTATEAPLELRLDGRPLAVLMRTPGADRELAAGFLLAERVIRSADDLGTIEYCTDAAAADAPAGSIVTVSLDPSAAVRAEEHLASRRHVMASAACGVCGRETLASLQTGLAAVASGFRVAASVSAPSSLAVSLANEAGITLVGFVRDGGLNIYTAPARIV
jgi:FdhD protein